MSRLGKVPVSVPAGVKIAADAASLTVTGPKGSLKFPMHSELSLETVSQGTSGATARISRKSDSREARAHHGMTRAMLANMVRGVTDGYERRLEVNGVGWGAKVDGKTVVMTVGYCQLVRIPIPQGVTVECPPPNGILIKGIDRQVVGQLAAQIRATRPPEPYNAKGVKYSDEIIKRKQGKSFGTT